MQLGNVCILKDYQVINLLKNTYLLDNYYNYNSVVELQATKQPEQKKERK